MKRVLITGAAGSVGSRLRKTLRGKYLLRLSDVDPISKLADGEAFVAADVTDAGALLPSMEDVHGVVHLGGGPCEDARAAISRSSRKAAERPSGVVRFANPGLPL